MHTCSHNAAPRERRRAAATAHATQAWGRSPHVPPLCQNVQALRASGAPCAYAFVLPAVAPGSIRFPPGCLVRHIQMLTPWGRYQREALRLPVRIGFHTAGLADSAPPPLTPRGDIVGVKCVPSPGGVRLGHRRRCRVPVGPEWPTMGSAATSRGGRLYRCRSEGLERATCHKPAL